MPSWAASCVGALPICGTDDGLQGALTDWDTTAEALRKAAIRSRPGLAEPGRPHGANVSVGEIFATTALHKVAGLPVIDSRRRVGTRRWSTTRTRCTTRRRSATHSKPSQRLTPPDDA
ncbi:hypothetical protein [Streptomyces sp. NPDC056938]|uniref:hypothetical protein n=1 Tax=unclassified Streptomyces TaxID=2593676 RepID=UPI003638E990